MILYNNIYYVINVLYIDFTIKFLIYYKRFHQTLIINHIKFKYIV